ncbi:predicted protein [Naegleria gruberi]|uniref:Predicted protein n=1 Tax=Naegleria gruberi TaxID=5762 RepID=D2VIA0_NAEGR|nr:uncharacterized protein NAEGRDRAFT_68611 [Naegleria gruberi]EFC43474.1 predicted protein [Naegleria gruberi]|eukprot:XP_002676218.1 predicted protein [Naegleria gruberi strain NEG-M]
MTQQPIQSRPILYLVGDSLTEYSTKPEGLHSRLLNWMNIKVDIINRGYSGWNTDLMRLALEKHFDQSFNLSNSEDYNICVFICLGANDASSAELPLPRQHVPLERFGENLKKIIEMLKSGLKCKKLDVLLCTPPPVNTQQYAEFVKKSYNMDVLVRSRELVAPYAESVRNIVKESVSDDKFKVHLVDLWTHDWESEECFTDGLHFNSKGYEIMFESLKQTIKSSVPNFNGDSMPFSHMYWRDYLDYYSKQDSQ